MQHIISNVSILYPRLNQPYRFVKPPRAEELGLKGKSEPCDHDEQGAGYETNFIMNKDEAVSLGHLCKEAYANAVAMDTKGKWPEKPKYMPAKSVKQEDGSIQYVGKCRINAKYGREKVNPPKHVDAKRNVLGPDFRLTTGSRANIAVTIKPFYMHEENYGVSLRIRSLQVLELAPEKESNDPFEVHDGYTTDDEFASKPATKVEDILDDEIPF